MSERLRDGARGTRIRSSSRALDMIDRGEASASGPQRVRRVPRPRQGLAQDALRRPAGSGRSSIRRTRSSWLNVGTLQRDLGRRSEAMSAYKKALALDPNNALAHYNLGVILDAEGSYDDAIEEYRSALTLDPTLADPRKNPQILNNDHLLASQHPHLPAKVGALGLPLRVRFPPHRRPSRGRDRRLATLRLDAVLANPDRWAALARPLLPRGPPRPGSRMVDDAMRLMPPSLRLVLERHRAGRGARRSSPSRTRTTAAHLAPDNAGTLDRSVASAADDLVRSIEGAQPFRQIAHRFGLLAHFVAGRRVPAWRRRARRSASRYAHFARFCESRRARFPLVFYGHDDPDLAHGDFEAFARAVSSRGRAARTKRSPRAYAARRRRLPPPPRSTTARSRSPSARSPTRTPSPTSCGRGSPRGAGATATWAERRIGRRRHDGDRRRRARSSACSTRKGSSRSRRRSRGLGVEILSTGGTARLLEESGIRGRGASPS